MKIQMKICICEKPRKLPKLEHMSNIIAQRIPIWEYYHSGKRDYYQSKNINMFEGGKDE